MNRSLFPESGSCHNLFLRRDNLEMKLIVFDVDGTIIDSQNIIVACINRAYEIVGLPAPERAKALSIVGLSLPSAFSVLVGRDGPIEKMTAAYKEAYAGYRMSASIASPFFDGARELIETLGKRDDLMLGIATGKSRRGVNFIFEKYGWEKFFATVQTADDAASKPDPEMLQRAMSETGVEAEKIVMIGDTTFDMEMAARAGVRSIGVTWGYHDRTALEEQGAEALVSDYGELGAVLEGFVLDGRLNARA